MTDKKTETKVKKDFKDYVKQIGKMAKSVYKGAKNAIIKYLKEVFNNAETLIILVFASFGLTYLLAQVPFQVALPMWIENNYVIPVVSAFIVWGLCKVSEYRMTHFASVKARFDFLKGQLIKLV